MSVFEPSATAPALAREFVSATLTDWGVAEAFPDGPLLASELVTNAVRHARSNVDVAISLEEQRMRVEVVDRSELLPVLGDIDRARTGGWGLHIVDRLATRWGLEPHVGGKVVWCEVDTPNA